MNWHLPPDLSLRAPGGAAPARVASAEPDLDSPDLQSPDLNEPAAAPSRVAALPKGTTQDPYEKYGISKLNPDGTKKSDSKLREELRQAVIAEKRKTNPGYGTIRNIGDLFKED